MMRIPSMAIVIASASPPSAKNSQCDEARPRIYRRHRSLGQQHLV